MPQNGGFGGKWDLNVKLWAPKRHILARNSFFWRFLETAPPPKKNEKNSRDNLPKSQITGLQKIQNSLARAVVKAPKSNYITPIFRSLHWLKITERIECKLLSLTYKVLTTTQPSYLHNLITLQPPRSTRSSSLASVETEGWEWCDWQLRT